MSAGRSSKNNILAGMFVVGSIALALLTVVILSNLGDTWKPKAHYTVRFTIADGAEGLDKGAPVKIGGRRVGRVTSSEFVTSDISGEPIAVDVKVEMPAHIKLYSDADVQLIKPLLGSGSSINIVSLTGAETETPHFEGPPGLLHSGDMIYGHLGAPGFIAPTDYARLRAIIARVDRITAEAEPAINTIMNDATATVSDVRKIAGDASEKWGEWSKRVSDVLERVDKGSQQFDSIVTSVKDVVQAVKDGVADARDLLAKGKAVIDDNRKSIDDVVRNVKEFTEKVNGEWATKFTGILDQARTTLDSAAATAKDFQELTARRVPQLDDIIANAALAAQQLKLTTVEIRASPWRLLYQPTKKELENELLYNSVRQYSDAVGELKATAESLRSLSERASHGGGIDQAEVNAMSAKLREAFDKYQEEERKFLERWLKEGK